MSMKRSSILRIEVTERLTPVFGGTEFAGVGAYECLSGTVFGALDPTHPSNSGIVNLGKAPRDSQGMVTYESAFSLLKPIDAAKGNGWLMYDVPNRGNKVALTRLNLGSDGNRPVTPEHAGNGPIGWMRAFRSLLTRTARSLASTATSSSPKNPAALGMRSYR
jgi:hypothetical protein